jgi:hypothetical protein
VNIDEADPYSTVLSRINAAFEFGRDHNMEMSQKEYDILRAIALEAEAADPDFEWIIP